MTREYNRCNRCIMDTSDPNITFDEKGNCNHCNAYFRKKKKFVKRGKEAKIELENISKKIRDEGKNQKYDCVIGVSGGLDSTYAVYVAKEKMNLRPLAVHLDNGWNSRIATKNIMKTLRRLGIDLKTYVIDWEEFRDLQISYLKAGVVDIEALTDHAIKGALHKIASEEGVKYIITGTNVQTEGIMAKAWGHNKSDYVNIRAIHKKEGTVKMKTYPLLTLWGRITYQLFKKIKTVQILDFVPYNREKIKKLLEKECGYEDYGRKHGESVFTRFYQEYILPTKFKIDKRKAHYSALICAGQMTREEALRLIKNPLYTDEQELARDKEYVLRKLGIEEKEFDTIMKAKPNSHYSYPTADKALRLIRRLYYRNKIKC